MRKVLLHGRPEVGEEGEAVGAADVVGQQERRPHERKLLLGDDVRQELALQADAQLFEPG